MNLKKIGKVFTSKFVGTGPSSYKKKNYRAAVSQKLRNTISVFGFIFVWHVLGVCLYSGVFVVVIVELRGLSPRANYTDRAAAAGRRS